MRTNALCAAGLFLLAGSVFAQEFRATITGHITDPSNAAVGNASVRVKNVETNELATSLTDSQGSYTVPFLRPGKYTLTVEAPGFKTLVREGLTLNVGQTAGLDLQLDIGQVSEQVTVSAETPLLETEKADRGAVIDEERVKEFPLNARNPFMLATLSAGVNFNGNVIYQRPFDNGAIADWNINGGMDRSNEFLLDGAPNNAQAGGNNIALVPPVDSVQEFKIQTNSYDAQYGKSSGGIVNVQLKSGSNQLHGTLYEFLRRNALDANSFQNNAQGVPKVEHFLDQYGGAVGGPIFLPKIYDGRNRSFFFFNYEGYREGTPTPLVLSVPAPEFLQGDFSKLVDSQGRAITIYDPTTGRDVNGTWVRDAFPGNRIPAERLNPIAQKLLGLYPKPNITTPGAAFYSQQNLFIQGGENLDHDSFYNLVIKFDQNFGNNHHVFFRHASNDRTELRSFNGVSGAGQDGQFPLKRVNDAYVLDWVGTMSPTLIANARVSFNRYVEGSRGDANNGISPASFGFPASLVNSLPLPNWFGRFEFDDNYQALGRYFNFNFTNTFAIHPTITKIARGHSIKSGVDMRRVQYNQQNVGNPLFFRGTRAFTQRVYNQGDALSGNSIASFLIGDPGLGSVDYNAFPSTVQRYIAPYVQDDWKVSRRLTLNLGLRWDFNFSPYERHNRLNRGFDPTVVSPVDQMIDRQAFPNFPTVKGSLLFAGANTPNRAANLDWTAIQPRAGFAYQVSNRLVVRGGWGKYYFNPSNDWVISNGFSVTTPLTTSFDAGRTPVPNLLSNPYPNGISVPLGASGGPLTYVGRGPTAYSVSGSATYNGPNFFNPNFKVPYVYQFSFGLQYQVTGSSTLEISYVGNRAHKLETSRDYNEPSLAFRKQCNPLEGGSVAFCDALLPNPFYQLAPFQGTPLYSSPTLSRYNLARPFPQFGEFLERGRNDGKSWYNSMQVNYLVRLRSSWNFTVAYTLSKMIEQGRNFTDNSGNGAFLDPQAFVVQRGIYQYDRTHVLKVGSVYQLPFGPGRKWGTSSNPILSRILGGWENTAILSFSTGRPWDLPSGTQASAVAYVRDATNHNVDWNAPVIYGVRPCVAKYNNDNTITLQPYSAAVPGCGLDNYNFLILPSYAPRQVPFRDPRVRLSAAPQLDLSLNKNTRIRENMNLQFRAEAFNLTNTFYFPLQQFDNNPNNATFGQIIKGTVAQGNANFPRQIQLAVKFTF